MKDVKTHCNLTIKKNQSGFEPYTLGIKSGQGGKMRILLLLLSMLLFMASGLFAGTYSGGSGTSGDPYQIANLNDLQELSNTSADWGAFFIQTADVDASPTSDWNRGAGFSPIGNYTTNFTGSYNGQTFTINSIFINTPSDSYFGLFGVISNAYIFDLGVK